MTSLTPEIHVSWQASTMANTFCTPLIRDNTLSSPLSDGGGDLVTTIFESAYYKEWVNANMQTKCSNVPRTFLNEETCKWSSEADLCTPQDTPDIDFRLEYWAISKVFDVTADTVGTRYIYAVDGLRSRGYESPPISMAQDARYDVLRRPNEIRRDRKIWNTRSHCSRGYYSDIRRSHSQVS